MNLYSSIKILDLTRVFSGPFATRHFADFGAEVIKIETHTGDDSRRYAPIKGDWSGYFEILNRNKTSIVLNLKKEEDLHKFYKLCKTSDIVVENFSPLVKKRLKIAYKDIKKINPTIIYASISGISEQTDRKYYDVIAQAESGLTSLNGVSEDMKMATSIVDAFAGMKLSYAIASALFAREKNGKGCHIFVSMLGSAFDLLEQNLISSSLSLKNPTKVGNMDSAIAPFGIFKTKDGSIAIAIGNDTQWRIFAKYFEEQQEGLLDPNFNFNQGRLEHLDLLKSIIENIFSEYTTRKLSRVLNKISIPCGISKTMLDIINDQNNYSQELLQKVYNPKLGMFVVPTGGIFYSSYRQESYRLAPKLPKIKP